MKASQKFLLFYMAFFSILIVILFWLYKGGGFSSVMPVGAMPPALPTCVSASINPYRLYQPPNQVTGIFSNYKSNPISYDNVRQDAFIQLGKQIQQRSDYEDVTINESTVRIAVTYLDPILVQYIILNEVLSHPNNLMDQSQFEGQIHSAMTSLTNRNEIVFIVTVTSQFQESPLYVNLPITKLELISSSGKRVPLLHYDPILGERNDVSKESLNGFVGFPVSLLLEGNCTGVVNQWTTSLTLDFKSFLSQDHPFYPLFWNIPYRPLVILQGEPRPVPTVDPFFDTNRYNRSNTPPPPDVLANDDSANLYWEEMGRYIWNQVIMMDSK